MVETHLRIDQATVDLLEPVERIGGAKHHHYELRGADNVFVTVTGGPIGNWIGTTGRVLTFGVPGGVVTSYDPGRLRIPMPEGARRIYGLSIWLPRQPTEPGYLVAIYTRPGVPVPPADPLSAWLRLTFLPDPT